MVDDMYVTDSGLNNSPQISLIILKLLHLFTGSYKMTTDIFQTWKECAKEEGKY